MITNEELNAAKLSLIKKDFYQVWNELLDYAQKASERWDPQNTNESDPGIVLLKSGTALTDKIIYNADVNVGEVFMPTASQLESMRRLTEMQGYNMKYYQSATTMAKITFNTPNTSVAPESPIKIDKFTNLKDIDDTINYVTLKDIQLSKDTSSLEVPCIEGELVECETDNDNIVSLLQLDDNNRYYLPETQVAENGIFISNINDGYESTEDWDKVDNLNTQKVGKKCYKFGYDSRVNLPYVQFPADISNIIEDGLKIKYIRTNGINGNISKNTLYKMEKPASWQVIDSETDTNTDWHNVDNYTITNPSAAKNGANIETLNSAYNNFKKTIGTFDTLVTCRDYMNKIYQLTISDTDTIPLVSNIIVSDIRDDINYSNIICSFGDFGIEYNTKANNRTIKKDGGEDTIKPFDLIFYPFKTVYGLNTKDEFVKSFKYDDSTMLDIKHDIEEQKTMAHNILKPNPTDVACIKNYYNLKATITTTYKVNAMEQADILNNVYSKLFETFNMRKVDFGEELSDDMIIAAIESADPRIKNVGWQNPDIETKICLVNGSEDDTANSNTYYNKLILNNVLAGRITLFNYNEGFKPEYNEAAYTGTDPDTGDPYNSLYPAKIDDNKECGVSKIETEFKLDATGTDIKLAANEVVQFRAKNLRTVKTYPAYVNYFLHLNSDPERIVKAIPATMRTIKDYLNTENKWTEAIDFIGGLEKSGVTAENFKSIIASTPGGLFKKIDDTHYQQATEYIANIKYYYLSLDRTNFGDWRRWTATQDPALDIYWNLGYNAKNIIGELVNYNLEKFIIPDTFRTPHNSAFEDYYVPRTWDDTKAEGDSEEDYRDETKYHTEDGLGRDGDLNNIPAGMDYRLKEGEYLCINYTHASSTEEDSVKTVMNEIYKVNDIIRSSFALSDSKEYRSLHSYNKTTGFEFPGYDVPGMFTLSADQQIETRDFVEVELDALSNIYWTRNDEQDLMDEHEQIEFKFDEDPTTIEGETVYMSYTLKDGEYFYYTNSNKSDLAYYGSGTKITKSAGTPRIYKTKSESTITAEDISSLGLSAAIPWRTYNFGLTDAKVTLTEYQYINLTNGNTLITLSMATGSTDTIDNDWQYVKDAQYIIDSGEDSLPKINIDPERPDWEVRTRLELDVSPTKAQVLRNDSGCVDSVKITYKNNELITCVTTITPTDSLAEELAIKATKVIQSATTETMVGYTDFTDTENTATHYDCQMKVFATGKVLDNRGEAINFNNYGDGKYTKLDFANSTSDDEFTSLNVLIPDDHFGLIMMYYTKNNTSGNNAKIRCVTESAAAQAETGTTIAPAIFNHPDELTGEDTWWDAPDADGYYALREGINVVYISESCELQISDGGNKKGNLVISNLDVVDAINPLNSKLCYGEVSGGESTAYEQARADIRALDPDNRFYYNNVTTNDIAIEINADDADDNLKNPHAWFSYNNINNKFVISEINANTLTTGVIIGKNSKL